MLIPPLTYSCWIYSYMFRVWCNCITLKYVCHSWSVQLILIYILGNYLYLYPCILLVLIYTFTWIQVCNYIHLLKTTWLRTFECYWEFGRKQKKRAKWEKNRWNSSDEKISEGDTRKRWRGENVAWVSGKWEHGKRFSRIHVSKLR